MKKDLITLICVLFLTLLPGESFAEENIWLNKQEPIISRIHFKSIGSTQDVAEDMVKDFKENPSKFDPNKIIVISAAQQTKGRGFSGRKWVSPPGNLYVTYIIPWSQASAAYGTHYFSHVTGLTMAQVLEGYGLDAKIKWLNDILVNNKKIVGILCKDGGEITINQDSQHSNKMKKYHVLIVGIGLNINSSKKSCETYYKEIEDKFKVPIISMNAVKGKIYNIEEILNKVTAQMLKNYKQLADRKNFPQDFLPLIHAKLAYLREPVFFIGEHEDLKEGKKIIFHGMNEKGRMIYEENGIKKEARVGRIRSVNDFYTSKNNVPS